VSLNTWRGRTGQKDDRQNFTIGSYGQDVATVIEKLEFGQSVLIGFSMGARVVIEAANRVPESVSGVVLIDDLHDVEATIPSSAISNIEDVFMDLVTDPSNEKLVSSNFYLKDTEASFQRLNAMLQGAPRIGWRGSLRDSMRWRNEDCIRLLSQLQIPIVAITAELQPTKVDTFRNYAPSFQAKIVPNTGHLVMWDAPEEFHRLLEESIQALKGGPN
jgi:pimeloyl-ACP methyl ester carboxylesterase